MYLHARPIPVPFGGDVSPLPDGRIAIALAAAWSGQEVSALVGGGRGPAPLTRARHLASYLGHVVLGLPAGRMAAEIGRDRTSLAYACARIEDARDDADFDRVVARLEAAALYLRGR